MIAVLLAVTALASAAVDPCAPVVPAPEPNPASAAAYHAVGNEERAAGNPDAAAVAFRRAAELDPGDAAARRALAESCQATRREAPPGHFERGLALMQAGDFRGAAAEFDEELARGADSSTALLAGVCRYQAGDTARAGALLRVAEADPVHAAVARYYLGLLAVADGRYRDASLLLDRAADGPEVGMLAGDLARYAWRNQPLVFTAFTAVGWDSNATLAPAGTPIASASDGAFDLGAAALYRPSGDRGPYLRASGSAARAVPGGLPGHAGRVGGSRLAVRRAGRRAGAGLRLRLPLPRRRPLPVGEPPGRVGLADRGPCGPHRELLRPLGGVPAGGLRALRRDGAARLAEGCLRPGPGRLADRGVRPDLGLGPGRLPVLAGARAEGRAPLAGGAALAPGLRRRRELPGLRRGGAGAGGPARGRVPRRCRRRGV